MTALSHIKNTILKRFRERMEQTSQSARWHGEGNVYNHTLMVVEALESLPEYESLPERQRDILYCAALLHDIGKTVTTKEIAGDVEAPHHAPAGSRIAREILWTDYNLCGAKEYQELREAICMLIRYHSLPPHIINDEDGVLKLHRIASNSLLCSDFSVKLLCILAKADMQGRICDDKQEMLDRIALCEELAKEEGCIDGCYSFPSDYTRRAYLKGRDVWKSQELHDDTWGEVIIMSGLPGTGKDTWIRENLKDMPMISLDAIRKELKISPKSTQGTVANLARERAKEMLRHHQPFVWNATNLTSQMRDSLTGMIETYHASARIVYLETDWQTQLVRNSEREAAVPKIVVRTMLGKLTLPEAFEAQTVEWL